MREYRLAKKNVENNLSAEEKEKVLATRRDNVRERVQKHRMKVKTEKAENERDKDGESVQSSLSDMNQSYNSNKTLGKAVKKVSRAFPNSPRKKRAVLAQIVINLDQNEKNALMDVVSPSHVKKTSMNRDNNIEIHDAVKQFLQRDDISRMSPKTRDVKSITCPNTGENMLVPTRHMLLSLREAYAVFTEERKNGNKGIAFY